MQKYQLYAIRIAAWLVLASMTFYLGRGTLKMYGRYSQASVARVGAESELQSLEHRKVELEQHLKHLSSERGMEQEFRLRYGVAEEGEGVIELVAPTSTIPTETRRGGIIEWFKRLF